MAMFRDECDTPIMTGLLQDLSYALRQLRKSPGFTVVAVITLALGIGANTAIFSVVNAVLFRPLPYPNADQLVMLWEQNPHRGWFENIVSGENFLDWEKQNQVFAGVAAFESNSFTVTGNRQAEELAGQRVSANLFSVLGVQAFRGRLFLPEENRQKLFREFSPSFFELIVLDESQRTVAPPRMRLRVNQWSWHPGKCWLRHSSELALQAASVGWREQLPGQSMLS